MAKAKPAHPNAVTPESADLFVMYVRKWQDALNLSDWRLERSNKAAAKANLAEVVKRSLPDRLAVYRIGEDFGSIPISDASLEQIALHEVLHIFLHELIETAKESQTITQETLASVEHRVINSLVAFLVPGR